MATVSITVPDGNVAEVRAALGHVMGLRNAQNELRAATAGEVVTWMRRQVRDAVLRYRESQRADIDRTDPTSG